LLLTNKINRNKRNVHVDVTETGKRFMNLLLNSARMTALHLCRYTAE